MESTKTPTIHIPVMGFITKHGRHCGRSRHFPTIHVFWWRPIIFLLPSFGELKRRHIRKRSSNIYCSTLVVGPTSLMIGVGLGIAVCSSNKLGGGVVVKRKLRWWATRLMKKIKDEL